MADDESIPNAKMIATRRGERTYRCRSSLFMGGTIENPETFSNGLDKERKST